MSHTERKPLFGFAVQKDSATNAQIAREMAKISPVVIFKGLYIFEASTEEAKAVSDRLKLAVVPIRSRGD